MFIKNYAIQPPQNNSLSPLEFLNENPAYSCVKFINFADIFSLPDERFCSYIVTIHEVGLSVVVNMCISQYNMFLHRSDHCPFMTFQSIDFTVKILVLSLKAPIATKVVCFSRLLKCLRSLYGKQCGPRSNWSSLFWVHSVCFYT